MAVRFRTVREPVRINVREGSMYGGSAAAASCPSRASTTTASNGRFSGSFSSAARSRTMVIEASLKSCLNCACTSASAVSSRTVKTDEETGMKAPREEGGIIAQGAQDVNCYLDQSAAISDWSDFPTIGFENARGLSRHIKKVVHGRQ
ncbi:hypothetical protein NITMOv2_0332 [Nitrospira moscoviensis]|uniref:Uncharacterized protein n=1 Tax=Nitrospira moscoviensis TaxID=42253 RepID=A0A0K2G756_NITMO|nr:hypothetical protein NITMOv2_0332 [Nitrospira moscoviensis]